MMKFLLSDTGTTPISQLKHRLRLIARKAGVGRFLVSLDNWRATGLRQSIKVMIAKRTYLPRILNAKPIMINAEGREVHMLLNHKRHLEGLWSLYSFTFFSGAAYKIVVHSDGTLTDADSAAIRRVFPGCRIIPRDVADAKVIGYLEAGNFEHCAALRRTFIFSLQLFDPTLLAEAAEIINLDADVLFFATPSELTVGHPDYDRANVYYSLDSSYSYALSPVEIAALLGREGVSRLNSGILRLQSTTLNLPRIEGYLNHPGLMVDGKTASYYTEQTIFALEFTEARALPLPATYAICAPEPTEFVAGHYCGGSYWASLFYTRGLPYLANILLK